MSRPTIPACQSNIDPGQKSKAMTENEKPDNRTGAQKRRAEYQEQQREHLRGLGLMQQIQADIESVSQETLGVIKYKTETRLKLLAKILPDLREVANTGPDGEALVVAVADREELRQKIRGAPDVGLATLDYDAGIPDSARYKDRG